MAGGRGRHESERECGGGGPVCEPVREPPDLHQTSLYAEAPPEGVPAHRPRLAGRPARQETQRDTRGRDGTRQDHPDHRPVRVPGLRTRHLGPPPHRGAYQHRDQLGNGAQEVVSWPQGTHLLRLAEGTQAETHRLVQVQLLQRVHHLLQAGGAGPVRLQAQAVVLPRT